MANYVVGDIQGCFDALTRLLQAVDFQPSRDTLYCVGDLVARGPDSLATLRLLKSLDNAVLPVLGNHDLHLLAVANRIKTAKPKEYLEQVLMAEDAPMLYEWLRQQPLCRYVNQFNIYISHAGCYPWWSGAKALALATEVSAMLCGEDYPTLLTQMYNDRPNRWLDTLSGYERLRFIINAFTRMRYVSAVGELDMSLKCAPKDNTVSYWQPWFTFANEAQNPTWLFGHWAALMGETLHSKVPCHALDTGCVWGQQLTLLHLEANQRISVNSELFS